jgi:hypothetical protein
MEADFVEHPAKEDDAADLLAGTSQTGDFHGVMGVRSVAVRFSELKIVLVLLLVLDFHSLWHHAAPHVVCSENLNAKAQGRQKAQNDLPNRNPNPAAPATDATWTDARAGWTSA